MLLHSVFVLHSMFVQHYVFVLYMEVDISEIQLQELMDITATENRITNSQNSIKTEVVIITKKKALQNAI